MASISSRILRLPRSAQIAEPPAPAISNAHTIGLASRTMASTLAAPTNDCAPIWVGQAAELQRDHRSERDGDQRGRDDGDAGDEPGLLDELANLERTLERQAPDVQEEREEPARLAHTSDGGQ